MHVYMYMYMYMHMYIHVYVHMSIQTHIHSCMMYVCECLYTCTCTCTCNEVTPPCRASENVWDETTRLSLGLQYNHLNSVTLNNRNVQLERCYKLHTYPHTTMPVSMRHTHLYDRIQVNLHVVTSPGYTLTHNLFLR